MDLPMPAAMPGSTALTRADIPTIPLPDGELHIVSTYDIDRFFARVSVAPDGCWIWDGARYATGYGTFAFGKKSFVAHRVAYLMCKGAYPLGLDLDHLCRVRPCVNPAHLEPVTRQENLRRSPLCSASRTHCPHGHEYDAENTYVYEGRRFCRACRRRHDRRRAAARAGGAR